MFENHNQLFFFKGLGIICIRMSLHLGRIKCVFFKHVLAHQLQDKNDFNLVLLMQKLSGYQIKVISVFYVSVSDVKYLEGMPRTPMISYVALNILFCHKNWRWYPASHATD